MSGATIEHRNRVEWVDTDAAGIYHHTTVARFVEAAEAALWRARGLESAFMVMPRVHYEVDFEAPLVFGQEATTSITVERIGRTSMTYVFEVWGEAVVDRPRRRAAHGRLVTVHVGHSLAQDAVAVPWPEHWVAALSG